MDSMELRFQPGLRNCCWQEKVGDFLLAFPRAMWGDKQIVYLKDKEQFEIQNYSSYKAFMIKNDKSVDLISAMVLGIPYFIIGPLVALPFLAIGLLFKDYAISKNETSKQYSEAVKKFAKSLDRVEKEKTENNRGRIFISFPNETNEKRRARLNKLLQQIKPDNSFEDEKIKIKKEFKEVYQKLTLPKKQNVKDKGLPKPKTSQVLVPFSTKSIVDIRTDNTRLRNVVGN